MKALRPGVPGLRPGMQILAVNNQEFSAGVLDYAIKKAQHSTAPISLITSQTGWFQTLSLDYHDGMRYPHLERIEGTPDMLAAIHGAARQVDEGRLAKSQTGGNQHALQISTDGFGVCRPLRDGDGRRHPGRR